VGYTTPHRPLSSTNENGVQATFAYDSSYRRTAKTEAYGTSKARPRRKTGDACSAAD
jgi:YD repeat-containing protein